jgi:hypothetical protein
MTERVLTNCKHAMDHVKFRDLVRLDADHQPVARPARNPKVNE